MMLRALGYVVVALAAAGCAGTVQHMTAVPNVDLAAASNESIVVFMRPSGAAFAVQSEVYEAPDGQPARLAGIVAAKKKVAYRTPPGEHLFMVIGEAADFMSARLDPGKVYYVLVTPRVGLWKARFSLRPVHPSEATELGQWQSDTAWVQVNEDSARWAAENAADVEALRGKYMPEWTEKADKPVLRSDDAP
jgi:hypothetical protein